MKSLKLSNEGRGKKVLAFREAVLSKDMNKYIDKYKRLKELEEKLIRIETKIYGADGPIKIGYLFSTYSSDGKIVIDPIEEKITVNKYLRNLYGGGHIIRKESIEGASFSISNTCLSNENVIITLRRLLDKTNKKLQLEYNKELEKKYERFKIEKPEEYNRGVRPVYSFEEFMRNNRNIKMDIDEFFKKLISNIDYISYFLEEHGVKNHCTNEEIYCEIKRFNEKVNTLLKIANMPSKNPIIEKIKEVDPFYIGESSSDDVFYVINTIKQEIEEAEKMKEAYPEYDKLKKEYYELLEEIENLEDRFFSKLSL